MWSVFFLVPVGRGVEEERITPEEYEIGLRAALAPRPAPALCGEDDRGPALPPLRAPARRRPAGRAGRKGDGGVAAGAGPIHAPGAVGRGRRQGGDVRQPHRRDLSGRVPAALLRPFPRTTNVVDVYQNHPTFRLLRDPGTASRASAACANTATVCGGSRARAYAVTGDPMAAEPDCIYVPGTGAAIAPRSV